MTPALFAGAFRAGALSPRSLADWLSGTPAAALRPKAPRRAGLRGGEGSRWAGLRLTPLALRAMGVACTADLAHLAACREGCGSGAHVGLRPPDTFFLTHHAAPDCGKGKAPAGRTAPSTFGASGKTAPAFPSTGHAFRLQISFARRVPFALRATRTAATGHLFLTPSRRPV